MTKKLAVIGSRDGFTYEQVKLVLDTLTWKDVELISGGARGVDSYARDVARKKAWAYTEFPAEWEKYGKRAGMVRNAEMITYAEYVIAFWNGKSPGTKAGIEMAKKAKKNLAVIKLKGGLVDGEQTGTIKEWCQ